MKISYFGPSFSVESWYCSDSCLLSLEAWSLTQAPIPFQTFCYCINFPPCLSLLASTEPQSGCVPMGVARSLPDKDEHQSLFVSWALLQQNVNQFQVGQCLQLWTLETFTSEIILPCCLLIYFKLVYHELTSLHIHYECVWITPVASWNYTSILPKILVYKFGWCHDCRIIPQWPNQDRHFGQVRKAQSLICVG